MRLVAIMLLLLMVAIAVGTSLRAHWVGSKVSAALTAPSVAGRDDARCDERRGSIIIIGDSRISRWPMRTFGDLPVVNKGIAGETALQLSSRFERDVIACHARSVLIAAGINDLIAASLLPGDKAREIVDRLPERLIDLAEQAAGAGSKVWVATVIPPSRPDLLRRLVWSEAVRTYVRDVNARLRSHSWTGAMTLVDFAAALDPHDTATLLDRFRVDTLHINTAAYDRLTSLVHFVAPAPSDTSP